MLGIKSHSGIKDNGKEEGFTLSQKLETGFPSPAADHLEKALSLEKLVVFRPSATFYVRAEGNAMARSGIHDKDILIVDRSITPKNGHLIITSVNDEPIIRRFTRRGIRIFLLSDDVQFEPILIQRETEWIIWGVITHVVHRFRLENLEQE